MLQAPTTACATPGCAGEAAYGKGNYCPPCKRQRNRRFDTKEWQLTRERILTRDPVCTWQEEPCFLEKRCFEESKHVDHVVAVADGGDDGDENLQGLCSSHHNVKTRREQQTRRVAR